MLRDLLRRNKRPDTGINESHEIDTTDDLQTVKKKKADSKKLLVSLLVIVLCAGLGFTFITSMMNSGSKKLQTPPRKVLTLPPGRQVADAVVTQSQQNIGAVQSMPSAIAAVAGQWEIKPVPVPGPSRISAPGVLVSEKKNSLHDLPQKGQSITKVIGTEGRDVFKEFYVKGIEPSGDTPEMKRMMAGMGKIDGLQLQPPAQAIAPPLVEQVKDIRIFGITCAGEADCIAITSEGALKKGDMVGSEIVNNVNSAFLTTNKRVVNW